MTLQKKHRRWYFCLAIPIRAIGSGDRRLMIHSDIVTKMMGMAAWGQRPLYRKGERWSRELQTMYLAALVGQEN